MLDCNRGSGVPVDSEEAGSIFWDEYKNQFARSKNDQRQLRQDELEA
jgi:hypothetical protein